MTYWTNFAKIGNPNGPGLPHWPTFTIDSQRLLRLDDKPVVGPIPRLAQLEALDRYYAMRRLEAAQRVGQR